MLIWFAPLRLTAPAPEAPARASAAQRFSTDPQASLRLLEVVQGRINVRDGSDNEGAIAGAQHNLNLCECMLC